MIEQPAHRQADGRDDADLVVLAQAGSAEAFGVLYDRHASGVGRALASFAGPDRDLLDDLVQDVFVRVATSLHTYVPRRPFNHWLYTVALNVGRNHARRRSGRPEVARDPADLAELAGAGVAPIDVDDALLPASLMRMVAALPVAMREVVSLRVGGDLAYADVAELLGIPEGTARRRMHQALAQLKQRLDDESSRRSEGDE